MQARPFPRTIGLSEIELRQDGESLNRYLVHGLRVFSRFSLPELSPLEGGSDEADVFVDIGDVEPPSMGERVLYFPKTEDDVILGWKHVGAIRVEEGRRLVCCPTDGDFSINFRLFLLCQAMGVLLQQRGMLVLHASAVEIDGLAVAFIGVAGRGKSTMATAAYTAGAKLISDDVLGVCFDQGEKPKVVPSFPQMRLSENTLDSFGFNRSEHLSPIPNTGKFLYNATSQFAVGPKTLARIYVLADSSEVAIAPLQPQEALLHLIEHTYGRSLVPYLGKRALHLSQCSSLVNGGYIKALHRPRSMSSLKLALECVRADLQMPPPYCVD